MKPYYAINAVTRFAVQHAETNTSITTELRTAIIEALLVDIETNLIEMKELKTKRDDSKSPSLIATDKVNDVVAKQYINITLNAELILLSYFRKFSRYQSYRHVE